MDFFHRKKNKCEQCDERFTTYDELIHHARHIHHHQIVKCTGCGKEFIYEKDRRHHARKEHEKKMFERSHKEPHHDERRTPQDRVDKQTHHFSDEL